MPWFTDLQTAALADYEQIPTPTRKDENWRFGNIKQLADITEVSSPSKVEAGISSSELLQRSQSLESPIAKFVFLNDDLLSKESSLPEEVICLPLADAIVQHGDLVEKHFMQQEPRLGSAKFAALHKAKVSNGLFVYVPANVKVDGVIEVFHWAAGDKSVNFPHTLIVTENGASVRVIDYFQSENTSDSTFTVAVNDLIAGDYSQLDYLSIQDLNPSSKIIQINETEVNKGSNAKGFILNTGAKWARNESLSRLVGEESRSDMLSISVPSADEEYDQRTFQHHVSRGAYSDLLYKNTLFDKSKTVFSGLIFVDEGAHDTDAYQTCRNLFMSDEAEANSMPGLEINADQVKCSHGSTSAQIDDEEIYYLCARGIPPKAAREMIAQGFSVEAIQRLNCEEVEAVALRFLANKFKRILA